VAGPGRPARLSTLPVPHPAAIPRQAPHRVIWRLVTGQPPAAGIAVRPPKLIPQPRHLPSARGTWRRVTGTGNAVPPPVTYGIGKILAGPHPPRPPARVRRPAVIPAAERQRQEPPGQQPRQPDGERRHIGRRERGMTWDAGSVYPATLAITDVSGSPVNPPPLP